MHSTNCLLRIVIKMAHINFYIYLFSHLVLVIKESLLQDVFSPRAAPHPPHHATHLPLNHCRSPVCGAQCHLMPGVGADPPPPLPSGKPVPAAGLGHSHHPGTAYDSAAPPPDDRSVHSTPCWWHSCGDNTVAGKNKDIKFITPKHSKNYCHKLVKDFL